jgi:hypothetical protein
VAVYLTQLHAHLTAVTADVDRRVPHHPALRLDPVKGTFRLAALKGQEKPDAVKSAKELRQSRLTRIDLVDLLIDIDHHTNFLRHFLHVGGGSRLSPAARRRNALAALMAIGCNLGPQRMAIASGLSLQEISFVADW